MRTHVLQGRKICLTLSVYAGIQSKLLDFCLLTAVCMVTQTETLVINCNENYFIWHSLHSHNRVFLSPYKRTGFQVSHLCAVYMGSRARADESTHCAAMQKGQASEPMSKRDCLLNTNQIRGDYRQWQQWVPMQCGCCGQGILWRNFTGTTSMIEESVHSLFQGSGSTQPRFTYYFWKWWSWSEWARSRQDSH